MKKTLCTCLIGTVMLSLSFTAVAKGATILGFDDITPEIVNPGYGYYVIVPDGYGGLNWGIGGESTLAATRGHSAFDDGDVSPLYGAIFGTHTHTITNPNPGGTFDFVGAYFTGGWYSKSAPVKGYLDNVEIYSTSVPAVDNAPTWHQFDWTGIDALVFPVIEDGGTPGNNDDYVVDNFTIDNISTVPEPSSFVLFVLVSLCLYGWFRRRS